MKTTKSSDSEEVTPSKKTLKQARLPFKILSADASPKSASQTRKRKLSVTESESFIKVGKITKQNDSPGELVIISDDDSQNCSQKQSEAKALNPFVKLVDTARKKKLQKSKVKKKKINAKTSSEEITNFNSEIVKNDLPIQSIDTDNESVKEMEVDGEEIKSSNTARIKVKETDETEKNEAFSHNESHLNGSCENLNNKHENVCSNVEKEVIGDDKSEIITVDTPKRVTKNNLKQQKSLNTSQISNCDESDLSPATPRRSNRSLSVPTGNEDVSLNESNNVKLTPKQLQKKLESAKKKDEKEKERLEREKKKLQEKEERAKQKQEKEDQRKKEREEKEEAKRKEREEKEEQKKKEREEKEKQRELEKKLREEKEDQKRKEKEEKEEQKRKEKEAREEERRRRQEALELEKQDQEQKKKKAAEAFVSFFVPKHKADKDQITVYTISKNEMLSSFSIKSDMRLAPTTRVQLSEKAKEELDNLLKEQTCDKNSLYIKNLKNGVKQSLSSGKTWPLSDKDDDIMIIEDELPPDGASEILTLEPANREKLRPKLLAFHENRRPPYWGTWRKKSSCIKPKHPFKMDQKLFDYDVDSDDDWEEEQEGESIDGSAAGSDDEQDLDEYEVDNDVFVPHGYLSDEEATMDEDDVLSLSPETQKARLKHLEDEFESEMKKPMEKLKPRLYGLLWETADGGKPDNCADALWNYFGKLAMIMNDPSSFLQPSIDQEETEKKKVKKKKTVATEGEQQSPISDKKKKTKSDKEVKKPKQEVKKNTIDNKKNQPGINTFLTKLKNS